MGALLYRGMLIGLIAGIVAFSFARLYGEPYVDRAIQFEEQVEQDKAIHNGETVVPEPELVSRQTQSGIGLLIGITVYGAAIGGLFFVMLRICLWSARQYRGYAHQLGFGCVSFYSCGFDTSIEISIQPTRRWQSHNHR